MIVGLLDSFAFNGSLDYYPFAFQKSGLTQIRQVVEKEAYPYAELQLNGNDALKDLRGYDRFLEACRAQFRHSPSMLKPNEWGQGKNCTLIMGNNVPSGILVWGEFEGSFDIDGNGSVLYKND